MNVMPYYMARRRLLAGGGPPPPAIPPNYFDDVMLQLIFAEADNATTGADDSRHALTWTGAGNAKVLSNELALDGTGDYIDTSAASHHCNWIHNGSPHAYEWILKGRPGTAHRNTLLCTNGGSSANRGVWIAIGDGGLQAVGTVRLFLTLGTSSIVICDYTTTFTIPNDGALHHLVIEMDPEFSQGTANKIRFGLDGVRQEMGAWNAVQQMSVGTDPTNNIRIGRANAATTVDYEGNIRAMRFWRDRLPYDLKNNSTYSYEADPTQWPTEEVATGPIDFRPRYWPKEESAAAGKVGSLFYLAEPRFIDLGGGEILGFQSEGPSHMNNTTTRINCFRSTNYGRSFPYSTRVAVASDGSNSCRNLSVGRDPSSGRLIAFYRKANGSTVTQGVFFKTSTDDGATWSSETAVTSSLTGASTAAKSIPWGKIVNTTNGLMATFYNVDFAEVLFSTDGGQTWGSRTTMYDVTGSSPKYNEPFVVALSTSNLVAMARRDASNNNDFAFYKSTDGGLTWSFSSEEQWTSSTNARATPGCMAVVGSNVLTMWGERGPTGSPSAPDRYRLFYTLTDSGDYLADPGRAVDGTETHVVYHPMRHQTGWDSANYGYPDLLPFNASDVLVGWYEPPTSNANVTRTMAALLTI